MRIDEAARLLAECHAAAPENCKVAAIHVFAIVNASKIDGMPLRDLAERAGISGTYGTELRKGINISRYVTVTSVPWE